MTLRLRNVQVDVPGDAYDEAVAFWATALEGTPRETDDTYVHLDGIRSPVGVHLQRLGGGDPRYHLDLGAEDPDREVERLLGLGATRVGSGAGGEVLRDPAGFLLCICAWGEPERLATMDGAGARLHFVVLDLPRERHDAARDFWAAAFGLTPEPAGPTFPAFTLLDGVPTTSASIGLLVQDVGDDAPRLHLDLHVEDPATRDAEVARLEGLGARRVAGHGHWVVLEAPGGHLLCVVPDRREAGSSPDNG